MAEKTKVDILKILIDGGLEEDVAKKAQSIVEKDIIPKNYIPSYQYNDKVLELADANKDLKQARDDLIIAKGYETKYNDEVKAHGETKTAIETEKALNAKKSVLHKQLAAEGANPKLLKLLEKEFDLAALELDGDGDTAKIKGWDKLSAPVKEQYSDVFGKVETTGANVADPPPGKPKPATNKDMNAFIRGTIN